MTRRCWFRRAMLLATVTDHMAVDLSGRESPTGAAGLVCEDLA